MYKVFLSWTSRDLADYREAVHRAIDGLPGFQLVKMEDFGARDENAKELCIRLVRESDLLVGLMGHYYGSCPPNESISYTELEYRTAKDAGLPRLIFVAPNDFSCPISLRESDASFERQQALRHEVMSERVVASFATPEQLASAVTKALFIWYEEQRGAKQPAVRADTEEAKVPEAEKPIGPNPYRGLEAFRKKDADRFFGREALVDRLWEAFLQLHAAPTEGEAPTRLLAILGASGSGKSSVAQAGLLAELEQRPLPGRPARIDVAFTPEARPLESLAVALARQATDDPAPAKKASEFEEILRQRTSHDGLRYLAERMLDVEGAGLILLVDQFEELYSLCEYEAERAAFIGNLLHAAREPRGRVSIILTLRSDFLGAVNQHSGLSGLIARQNAVVPVMGEDELRRAIEEPARRAGREIDPGTVDLLIEQSHGREGALPLLEFVLTRIWDGFGRGAAAADTVRELGGVGGALANQAQAVYESLGDEDRQIARRAFLAMVHLGEGTRDTRWRARLSEIVVNGQSYEDVVRVLQRSAERNCRLVTLGNNGKERTAEVTHEALLEQWSQVRAWLDGGRDDLRLRHRLNDAAREWQEMGEPEGLLWRPPLLDLLQEYRDRCIADMTVLQREFLSRSLDAQKSRAHEKQQLTNRALAAQSRYLASTAREILAEGDKDLALLLVMESLPASMQEPERPIVEASIRELFRVAGAFPLVDLDGHTYSFEKTKSGSYRAGKVRASFSPDSRYLVTASDDGTVRLWDAQDGGTIGALEGPRDSVQTAVFSPDGARVVTASADHTARLWDTRKGKELLALRGHGDAVCRRHSARTEPRLLPPRVMRRPGFGMRRAGSRSQC